MSSPASAASAASPLIYFCASIRGGSVDRSLIRSLIGHCATRGQVLTEHIGLEQQEKEGVTDQFIHVRDMAWLRQSHLVVAECSSPSLGVGYELAWAETLNKPTMVLFRQNPDSKSKLSAMINGGGFFSCFNYSTEAEATALIDQWIDKQMKENKQ